MWTEIFVIFLLLGFKDKSTDKLADKSVKTYQTNLVFDSYKYREDMKYYVPSFKTEFYHVFLYTGHTSSLALNILIIYVGS